MPEGKCSYITYTIREMGCVLLNQRKEGENMILGHSVHNKWTFFAHTSVLGCK